MLFLNFVFFFGFCDGAGFYEVLETIVDFEVRDGCEKRWIVIRLPTQFCALVES